MVPLWVPSLPRLGSEDDDLVLKVLILCGPTGRPDRASWRTTAAERPKDTPALRCSFLTWVATRKPR